MEVGSRVKSLRNFAGVKAGSTGTIDEDYGTGFMVCWDPPISRNVTLQQCQEPVDTTDWTHKAAVKGFLRDGFDKETELQFLEEIA